MSRRILVVEDDVYIRESVRELLEDEGHVVVCAENGARAPRRARRDAAAAGPRSSWT